MRGIGFITINLPEIMSNCFSLESQIRILKDPTIETITTETTDALPAIHEYIGVNIPVEVLLEGIIPFVQVCTSDLEATLKIIEVLKKDLLMSRYGTPETGKHVH